MLNKRVADRPFLAGDYSIADMACYPWAKLWNGQGQDIASFPHMQAWLDRCAARPAVAAGIVKGKELREGYNNLATDKEAQKILFGQKAR